MIKLPLQKKTINSKIESEKKSISIQFNLDGFCFCITDIISKKPICFTEYSFDKTVENPQILLEKIKTIFKNDSLLQQDFLSITAIHQNRLATIVPTVFFDNNKLKNYLDYNIKTLETDFITFDDIPHINAKNIYIPYVNINNYLFQHFGTFEYKHHATVLITKFLAISKENNLSTFFVHISKKQLDIVIAKDTKLIFYNSFSFETKEDFIYYILFTAEQLKLNPNEFELIFSGAIKKESEIYTITHKYIRRVSFIKTSFDLFENTPIFENHSNYILAS